MRYVRVVLFAVFAATVIYVGLVYRFQNPGMTETQLFMANGLPIGVALACLAAWAFTMPEPRRRP